MCVLGLILDPFDQRAKEEEEEEEEANLPSFSPSST
jgi:hypothetical protein